MPATLNDIQKKYGESVYPLYKDQMHEPYMENDNGKGYKGVVLYDELEDKVRCEECGKWFVFLPRHVCAAHGFSSVKEYKNKYGLLDKTPLVSKARSKLSSDTMKESIAKGKIKCSGGKFGKKASRGNEWKQKAQAKNEKNLCDAQVAARLIVVRDMVGKVGVCDITMGDIFKYDSKLHSHLKRKYGNTKSCIATLGIKATGYKHYKDSKLLAGLRSFVLDNKRMPTYKELRNENGFAGPGVYEKHFGSWRRAKMMAGLDQLLAEVKNAN